MKWDKAARRKKAKEWLEHLDDRLCAPGIPIRIGPEIPRKEKRAGYCETVSEPGFRGFQIRYEAGCTKQELADTIEHEYAHYLSESSPQIPTDGEHGAIFGVYRAAVYRIMNTVT